MLRKLYGDEYWKEFAKQRPQGLRLRARNCSTGWPRATTRSARWPNTRATTLYKEKNAPIAFVAPPDGLPATPTLRRRGQQGAASGGRQAVHRLADVAARARRCTQSNPYLLYPLGAQGRAADARRRRLSDFKLLWPTDMDDYLASQPAFTKEWNGMLGL